jgi:hypothetical protein
MAACQVRHYLTMGVGRGTTRRLPRPDFWNDIKLEEIKEMYKILIIQVKVKGKIGPMLN